MSRWRVNWLFPVPSSFTSVAFPKNHQEGKKVWIELRTAARIDCYIIVNMHILLSSLHELSGNRKKEKREREKKKT